jgi:formylglycine-generating enzyme required for sulfatase activity
MSRIPTGTFMMGSSDGSDDERPVHEVTVQSFEMDVTEVTVQDYQACVQAGGCTGADRGIPLDEPCNFGRIGREKHPINCLDWHRATAYCQWAGKRLPTEEEWEYAARGSDGRRYPWGNEAPTEPGCWSEEGTSFGHGMRESTCPVGMSGSDVSPFGLYDMGGNVAEWTSSRYLSYADGKYPCWSKDPKQCPTERMAVRGGAFYVAGVRQVRATIRGQHDSTFHHVFIGLRCARSL